MTREEAKDIKGLWFGEYVKYNTVCKIIDAIYDDFESRTCDSCKRKQSCEAYASAWNQYKVEYNEFSCSLWEKKDDTTR